MLNTVIDTMSAQASEIEKLEGACETLTIENETLKNTLQEKDEQITGLKTKLVRMNQNLLFFKQEAQKVRVELITDKQIENTFSDRGLG